MRDRKKKMPAGRKRENRFNKILIANRGEIVIRIASTCKEMGIKTVGIHAEDDMNPLVRGMVDEYVSIKGKGASIYLDIPSIIKVAKKKKADAIHPGYGFLSENPHFARACEKAGIKFIGPPSKVLERSADKIASKKAAEEYGLLTLPYSGNIKSSEELDGFIKEHGYPIILKSALGGGGRGMRIIKTKTQIKESMDSAQKEVAQCFGYSSMFAEKYVKGRHIEFQFLTDNYGRSVCLFERECSIQRRFQKLIEEAPSIVLDDRQRKQISEKICNFATGIGYIGAGTIEFMITNGKPYFMELNPRIQVEHGVTEMITGTDIIKEQIRIAQGMTISKEAKNAKKKGHAIQCRIVAENPRKNFSPGQGTIRMLEFPEMHKRQGRIDAAIYEGMKTKQHYDSLLAKIIVKGNSREAAIKKMLNVLEATKLHGIDNTITFHQYVLKHPKFRKGHLSTSFLKDHDIVENFTKKKVTQETIAKIAAAIYGHETKHKIEFENGWDQKDW